MATVTVAFTPLPAHVRTARFVSASVARRAGVDENLLDEIRLAVSEACSLAVRLHLAYAPAEPVEMRLTEDGDEFRIEIADAVPRNQGEADASGSADPGDLGESGPGGPGERDSVGGGARDDPADVDEIEAIIDDTGELVDLQARERIGLAVIAGLVDDFSVDYRPTGSVISMSWPIDQDVALRAPGGTARVR